jgi:hypothetical protein
MKWDITGSCLCGVSTLGERYTLYGKRTARKMFGIRGGS